MMCWPSPLGWSLSAELKIPQMKTVSLRNIPLKAAFAGLLLSATLINAGDAKAAPLVCSDLNTISSCVFNDGFYKVDNFMITPSAGWTPNLDLLTVVNGTSAINGTLSVNLIFALPRSFTGTPPSLMYDVMKLTGLPIAQASTNATVGNVPPIGGGSTSVNSTITGLIGGSLASSNGAIVSNMFTTPVTSTKVTSVFSTTGPGTFSSIKTEFTPGAPVPPPSLVPGPLPLLGAGAAFGFSRRLRRRINTSATA